MVTLYIDGYNLIRRSNKMWMFEKKDSDLGRQNLISELAAYKQVKNIAIVVVFDGTASDNRIPKASIISGVTVVYTAFGQTADYWLIDRIRKEKEQGIIVSSDNEILHAAKAVGAGYITAEEFEQKMEQALRPDLLEAKQGTKEAQTHKRWMTQKKGPAKPRL